MNYLTPIKRRREVVQLERQDSMDENTEVRINKLSARRSPHLHTTPIPAEEALNSQGQTSVANHNRANEVH